MVPIFPDVVPLFPLPDHVLLIGLPTPFRLFEPRYRALAEHLAKLPDEERWLAIPRLSTGWQSDYQGAPAFDPIAALALARTIKPLANGQYLMMVEGLSRCRLVEAPSHFPFRLAKPERIADTDDEIAQDDQTLQEMLDRVDRLCERLGQRGEVLKSLLGDRDDLAGMIDRLGASLIGLIDDRQAFLVAPRLSERLAILNQALRKLLAGPRASQQWRPSEN